MDHKLSRRNIIGAAGVLAGAYAVSIAAAAAPVTRAVTTVADADGLALSLFRQWIAAANEYDRQLAARPHEQTYPASDLMTEIEDRILDISGGAVSLALKTHFKVRQDHAGWSPETRHLCIREAFEDDPDWEVQIAVAMLRDAAVIVPEILELAAPVLHEDAALIDAEIVIDWAREQLAMPSNLRLVELVGEEHEAEQRRKLETTLAAALDRVAITEAKTERGRAIKAGLGVVA